MKTVEYPKDYFVEFGGDDFLMGRITIFEISNKYNVDIDIVQKESGKIFKHVHSLYDQDDHREAIDLSVYHLKKFLDEQSK